MYVMKLRDKKAGTTKTLASSIGGSHGDYKWELKPSAPLIVQFEGKTDAQRFMKEYMEPYDPSRYDLLLVHYKPKGPKGLYGRERGNPSKSGIKIKAIYDAGEKVMDRYTVYFNQEEKPGMYYALAMSDHPFHPQGFGQHTSGQLGPHNGKRISFSQLPADAQKLVKMELASERTNPQPHWIKGTLLSPEDQSHVLRAYVHRFTGEHTPQWAAGGNYKVQFRNDRDWLEHTLFAVKEDGRLDKRVRRSESSPTWPEGKSNPGRRHVFRGMGPVGGYEYRTVNTSTEKGLREAERLKRSGWKIIRSGLFSIQFERRKSRKNPDDDFDLRSEMAEAYVITDRVRGGYDLSASGKYLGHFDEFDDALKTTIVSMKNRQFYPNIFFVNDHGNVDLLSVSVKRGKVTYKTIQSWV